jgi:hypothetical protein
MMKNKEKMYQFKVKDTKWTLTLEAKTRESAEKELRTFLKNESELIYLKEI